MLHISKKWSKKLHVFIECFQAATLTGTYKLIKRDLQREGFDIHLIGPNEEIFFMGPNDKEYRYNYEQVTIVENKIDHLLRVKTLQASFFQLTDNFSNEQGTSVKKSLTFC